MSSSSSSSSASTSKGVYIHPVNGVAFTPTFDCSHSVFLPGVNLSAAWSVFGEHVSIEKIVRLSSLCTAFTLGDYLSQTDYQPKQTEIDNSPFSLWHTQTTPNNTTNTTESAPTAATATSTASSSSSPTDSGMPLSLSRFEFTETVPLFFGLVKKSVHITVQQRTSSAHHTTLYESVANGGVRIRKWRRVYAVEEAGVNGVRVDEWIDGECSKWITGLVKSACVKSHKEHLDKYHTLFPTKQ